MPHKMVEMASNDTSTVSDLAEQCEVSKMATGFRLRNLKHK
jgi:hypothetical protein